MVSDIWQEKSAIYSQFLINLIGIASFFPNDLSCRPFYTRKFFLRHKIVSFENRYRFVPGQGHDLKKVIPRFPEIIESSMAKIMEGEVFDFGLLTGGLEAVFNFIKGLSESEKYPVRMESSR